MASSVPKLEAAMEYIKKELGEIKQDLKAHIAEEDTMMHRIEEKFTKWMQDSDTKYASKQTEKIVNAILILLFLGMAGVIITIIFEHVGLGR